MKKWMAFLTYCILYTQLFSQGVNDGKWSYTLYPANIIKLSWYGSNMKHAEQISDAVIAKPLTLAKNLSATSKIIPAKNSRLSIKTVDNSVTISFGTTLLHILNGFDSVHHRGINILLNPTEVLFGGGERALPLNRRGQRIPLYNNPWYGYGEGADALNYSVPILLSTEGYGLLFDNPSKGYFDVGKTRPEILEAGFESGAVDVYIIPGNNMDEILQHYTLLTGTQPLPPRWALGNFVSRFGYRSQQQAIDVVQKMKADHFPVDAVIIDLFWFGDSIKGTLGNLDWNRSKWPSPEKMIADFRSQNINTILVTEPFILIGTSNYAASVPHLATNKMGEPFELQDFYFGKGGLIDLFQPSAQQWFWQFYKKQMEKGIAGWWGDLGEPEKHPADMYQNASSFGVKRLMGANEVHNMYGHQWSKMLWENVAKSYPDKRLFYLNRAGFAGSQRFSVFPWTGDVSRSWGGLKAQLPNLQSMSLSGLPYVHSDAGGFAGGDTNPELYTRWLQFACFTPIFRPHGTALGNLEPDVKDIPSEPCFQPEPYKTIVRNVIRTRYSLLPYNYSLSYEQTRLGKPLIRPMFYYNASDTNLLHAGDQYMWGDAFLIAPVLEPNATVRSIYLPKGDWYNFQNNSLQSGPSRIEVPVSIENIPVFVKAGSFVPVWGNENAGSTADYSPTQAIIIRYYPSSIKSSYTFFDDDGQSKNSLLYKKYQQLEFTGDSRDSIINISIEATNWPNGLKRTLLFEVSDSGVYSAMVNGKPVAVTKTTEKWQRLEVVFDGKPIKLLIHSD